MIEKKGSDLHIGAGSPPMIRVDGDLQPVGSEFLTAAQAETLCTEILSHEQITKLDEDRELDLAFQIDGLSRFRGNCFWQQRSIAGAFRRIPFDIFTFEQLGLPGIAKEMTERPNGLVLVTGATGSGKSTTLATMIDFINQHKPYHIMTVEDPIEFVFSSKKSTVHQREVTRDTASFKNALKYILRQDPDVVLIGEMRDLETIQAAITIAETGHLVFATLHTNAAVQTIDRIIDVFPAGQQTQIRTQLSFVLQGIFCQQLLPKIGGGRTLSLEILNPTSAIRNLIREGKTHQLYAQMQVGQGETFMQTMNQSLAALAKTKKISKETALEHSPDLDELKRML